MRFAKQHPIYRDELLDLLHGNKDLSAISGDLERQFSLLFERPLSKMTTAPFRPHIVIIDALDECGSPHDQKRLAELLLKLARSKPWIKVFVTSRKEQRISEVLGAPLIDCRTKDIKAEPETSSDIQKYVIHQLNYLSVRLNESEVDGVVARADGLFIWCSTLFRYIEDSVDVDKKGLLEDILSGSVERANAEDVPDSLVLTTYHALYMLYDKILDAAAKHEEDRLHMRSILGIIYVTAQTRPLSIISIANCLRSHKRNIWCKIDRVRGVINNLHAVLYKDELAGDIIRVHHTSFLDFIRLRLGCEGWDKEHYVHEVMLRSCLTTMNKELRFNICEIESTSKFNEDIPELAERISQHVSEALQYSCLFWGFHILDQEPSLSNELQQMVTELFQMKVIFWIEVLVLLNSLATGVSALRKCLTIWRVNFSLLIIIQSTLTIAS